MLMRPVFVQLKQHLLCSLVSRVLRLFYQIFSHLDIVLLRTVVNCRLTHIVKHPTTLVPTVNIVQLVQLTILKLKFR